MIAPDTPSAPPSPAPSALAQRTAPDPEARWERLLAAIPVGRRPGSTISAFALATALVAVAVGLTVALENTSGSTVLTLSLLSVIVACWYGGFRVGAYATALSVALSLYFLIEPRNSFQVGHGGEVVRIAVFLAAALITCMLAEAVKYQIERRRQLVARVTSVLDEREAALRLAEESESRWRELAEAMPALVAQTDTEGRLVFSNRRYLEYTGKIASELMGEGWRAVAHPDDLAPIVRDWADTRNEATTAVAEWRIRRHDGEYRWHRGAVTPVRDASGDVVSWVAANVDIHDRKLAEQAISQSEARWRSQIDGLPVMIAEAAPGGRCTHFNRRFIDYTGCSSVELEGDGWLREVHPDDRPQVAAVWRAARTSGAQIATELRWRRADGEYRWHALYASPVRDANGEIEKWISASLDIHDRKLAGEALEASESRYKALVDTMTSIVWTADASGELSGDQSPWTAYTGQDREAYRGQGWLDAYHPDDRTRVLSAWESACADRAPYEIEARLRHAPSGRYRCCIDRGVPVRDARGDVVEWVGMVTDIDDQVRSQHRERSLSDARAALASSVSYDQALRALADALVPAYADWVGFTLRDDTGRVRRIAHAHNPDVPVYDYAAEVLDPYEDEKLNAGASIVIETGNAYLFPTIPDNVIDMIVGPSERDIVREAFRSAVVVPLAISSKTVGVLLVVSGTPNHYNEEDLAFVQEFARHAGVVLERAQLIDDLRRANAAKDEFLGLVSHELKTPITTIFGNSRILVNKYDTLDREAKVGALEDINRESARLHRIVDNLLILARLERGQELDLEPVLVRRIAERVIARHRESFPRRPINLHTDGANAVLATEVYIEQVLQNLLSNAEKYSPGNQPIDIVIETTDAELIARVLDRGSGIHDTDIQQLFTPFFRAPDTSAAAPGIGVGLAVCRRIIDALRGRMWAQSREGGGSEFAFALPLLKEEDHP
jgi:PAS domain S-box-containing protein